MAIDRKIVRKLLALVRRRYPKWRGFADPRSSADEIDYKQAAIARAADLLNREALDALISARKYKEFISRLERLGKINNLLFRGVPRKGDLGILYLPSLDRPAFSKIFYDLLYGADPFQERFERYLDFVRSNDLPNKWTFPTYFLFLLHPREHFFVKPSTMKWFLSFVGEEKIWNPTPSAATYMEIGRVVRETGNAFGDLAPRDMVDLQSMVWVAYQESKGREKGSARYWKIAPGENAWQWEESRDGEFISFGWDELGDLSDITNAEFRERRDGVVKRNPGVTKVGVDQAWHFSQIREGDRVVANRGVGEVLGIGTVTGEYYFVSGVRQGHRLPVRWDDLTRRHVDEYGWRRALVQLDYDKFEEVINAPPLVEEPSEKIEPNGVVIYEVEPIEIVAEPAREYATSQEEPAVIQLEYSLDECAEETGFDGRSLERWVAAIERKGQAIFYGAPGTGKTFVAEELARHLVGGGNGFVSLVQFHPAYSYEDFVLGIRPKSRPDGSLEYPLVPGRFLEFCARAAGRSGRCVLIVDEINRANLSRVFGELMYLLEYRDRQVSLAGGRLFSIPENVRVIGTMNTADRSIALVDHALRRRFAFLEIRPNYDALRHFHTRHTTGYPVDRLINVLRALNAEIGDRGYEVGISFFMREDLSSQIEDIWRTEIEPYLHEYFFDQPAKSERFQWDVVARKL